MLSSRQLRVERLEPRQLQVAGICNPFNALDVDDDGLVHSRDALMVINELNRVIGQSHPMPAPGNFLDVDGNGRVAPIDALTVINHLNRFHGLEVPLVFSPTPADDPDGNAVVLQSEVTVQGQTAPNARLRLRSSSGQELLTTADDSGGFVFRVELLPGENSLQVDAVNGRQQARRLTGHLRLGDIVLDWNAALLNVVRDWTALSNDPYPNRIVASQPPLVARNLAMVHAAMFDAANAFTRTHVSYRVDLEPPLGASPVAAVAAAAHRVASQLYREADERSVFDAALAESLATVADEAQKTLGIAFGQQVAESILDWRANDGANAQVPYVPREAPGNWKRTFPDYYPPLLPQWPNVTPFAISHPADFRPLPPPSLESAEYAAAVEEVMRLGGYGSAERTEEQTEIALFWADGGGTFTPPGHWNQIAADVALAQGRSWQENARLLALLNIALADAGIASWNAKYAYELWRPIDAIREADRDGNAGTIADSLWSPLLRTPPFPSYTSGHSTFSGAAERVLSYVLGDNVAFSSETDGHLGFTQRPLAAENVQLRAFTSFSQAAEEAGRSRVYGGIHFEFDNATGLAVGREIGNYVVTTILQPRS